MQVCIWPRGGSNSHRLIREQCRTPSVDVKAVSVNYTITFLLFTVLRGKNTFYIFTILGYVKHDITSNRTN